MFSFHRLRPNSRYVFRVAATNDRGQSPYSVQSDPVTTLEDSKHSIAFHFYFFFFLFFLFFLFFFFYSVLRPF